MHASRITQFLITARLGRQRRLPDVFLFPDPSSFVFLPFQCQTCTYSYAHKEHGASLMITLAIGIQRARTSAIIHLLLTNGINIHLKHIVASYQAAPNPFRSARQHQTDKHFLRLFSLNQTALNRVQSECKLTEAMRMCISWLFLCCSLLFVPVFTC